MPSKSLDIKIRIVLFIICSVGILYVSMKLFYQPTEGFQTIIDNCTLDTTTYKGKRVWKCNTEADALVLFHDTSVTINEADQVCFPTPNPVINTSNYFTCYQRPPGQYFDYNDGVFVNNNSITDRTPIGIENDMSQVCSDYNGETARFIDVITNQISTQQIISSASGRILFTTTQLINISTQYCAAPITDQKIINFCSVLNQGINIYQNLPKGNYGLNYISTTMTRDIYANTDDLYTNKYLPGYKGFHCSETS